MTEQHHDPQHRDEAVPGVVVDPDAPLEWNPIATLEDVRRDLDLDTIPERFRGRIGIVCRRWSGRERLAYEDALTARLLQETEAGDETIKLGTLRAFAATLTIRGSYGFELAGLPVDFLSGGRDKVEEDLLSITDADTYGAIVRAALEVQPLPSASSSSENKAGEAAEDPSQTPPTPPAALTEHVDTSASPSA